MPATTFKRQTDAQTARIRAEMLMDALYPYCMPDRCTIAGSLRRGQPLVGDIEIICVPLYGKATKPGELFKTEQNLVVNYLHKMNRYGHGITVLKGGDRYQQILFGDIQADVFMTTPEQWGRMLALRTGPASFVKEMAARCNQLGFKGINGELVKEESGYKPEFHTEKDFFDFLDWTYIPPENRN